GVRTRYRHGELEVAGCCPDTVQFGERHFLQLLARFLSPRLRVIEPPDKLFGGSFEGILRIDADEARIVDEREKEVAEFGRCFFGVDGFMGGHIKLDRKSTRLN